MNAEELRALQAPLKEKYRDAPDTARMTLRAQGRVGEGIACSLRTGAGLVEAGLRAKDLARFRYLEEVPQHLQGSTNSYGSAADGPTLGNPFSEMTPVAAVTRKSSESGGLTASRSS